MYVNNIWGIFFCIYLPLILTIYGAYKTGIEEGKRSYRKHKKVSDYKNERRYRARNFNK